MVFGVGVTGTVRGCSSRLLLSAVVGAGPRLAVAGSGTLDCWRAFAALENGDEGSPRSR